MPIRGVRSPWPKKGLKPTGIFSTRGRQKNDSVSFPNEGLANYAHSSHTRSKVTGASSAGQSLRHQKPKRNK